MKLRASLLAVALPVTLTPVLVAEPASATTITARTMLLKLSLHAESGSTTCSRTNFKLLIDANGDCQNTRAEVLIAESRVTPTYTTTRHCTVATGKWYSYHDGAYWTKASDVDIDRMVPLKEAWESGARLWSVNNRTRYANDLGLLRHPHSGHRQRQPGQGRPGPSRVATAADTLTVHLRHPAGDREVPLASEHRLSGAFQLSSILSGSCGSRAQQCPPVPSDLTIVQPTTARGRYAEMSSLKGGMWTLLDA
jgi:hypothetical protein